MGGRSIERLSQARVRNLKQPGRYCDGGGLWLQVRDAEQRSWMFRYTLRGKARWMGLGHLRDVTQAEAREKARDCRRLLLDGIDPIEHRDARKADAAAAVGSAMTFKKAAEQYIADHKAGWKNEKHAAQWESTLVTYAYPHLGKLSVAAIDTGAVLRVVKPIWSVKPETASRVRGRIERILDWAKVSGYRKGENPARLRGHLAEALPKLSKVKRVEHFAAMPWKAVSTFVEDLRDQDGVGACALEFAILTAARTNEIIGATWGEISLDDGTWIVPPERMKAEREHRVPLPARAIEILRGLLPKKGEPNARAPVFVNGRRHKALSNMAMASVLRRMEQPYTVHGFRSSFRDWAAESTNFPAEMAEMALAHTVSDKVEAAYRRGDMFEKRRKMAEAWARFCAKPTDSAKVIRLEARR